MLADIEQQLKRLTNHSALSLLKIGKIGLEKESLRADRSGMIAQTDHPKSLGSALTHPYITTDYSEALLEFVTPAFDDGADAINFLEKIHQFVYPNLSNECIWPASMPCRLAGEQSIRIAEYGTSNLGLMKNVYRRGLGYRYGKIMQVISGIHLNISMPDDFWTPWQAICEDKSELQHFINEQYFCAIRNLQRIGWLVPYLFGASPVVDESFTHQGVTNLKQFDDHTLYSPYATSLRLGDIGYTNLRENEIGVKACYDNLNEYIKCLTRAIETPYLPYEEVGVKVNGEYRQLNANILQIENEYYSTVRPKQIARRKEKPTHALRDRGVQYIEIRSIDLNPFSPVGITTEQVRFIEVLFIYCLLGKCSIIDRQEREEIDINEYEVAHHGRKPKLSLRRCGESISLQAWCREIFDALMLIARHMDQVHTSDQYTEAVSTFVPAIDSIEATYSAQMVDRMRQRGLSYYQLVAEIDTKYCKHFNSMKLDEDDLTIFNQSVTQSLDEQRSLEQTDETDFDTFLSNYFAQT